MKEFEIFGLKYIKNYRVFGILIDINGILNINVRNIKVWLKFYFFILLRIC